MNLKSTKNTGKSVIATIKQAIAERAVFLDLSKRDIKKLPSQIGQLSYVEELYLSNNQLATIPPEIGQLSNLKELYLSGNKLTILPPEIGQLSNLKELYLSDNKLTILPPEIGQLSNLKELYLFRNKLIAVPKELELLSILAELYLSSNQLTTVPEELGQLSNLVRLDLSYNQLTTVPKELGQLLNLERLYLNQNKLTSIPIELKHLSKLTTLDLQENKTLGIPGEILGPTWEEGARTGIFAKPKDILDYYSRVQVDRNTLGSRPLNEAKLIFVGFGAVGKTSIVNRLRYDTFDPDSSKTEGIQIIPWFITLNRTEEITLNIWDFGGQEIMHSTHQFFLTERSLYVLVLNGRQGHEDADAEYWLELIQSFGGDSPVIIVLNKMKEHPFDVNRRALQDKFKNIQAFIQTDCKTQQGIEQLKNEIERQTDRLADLRASFPRSWVAIKNELAKMKDNYISFEKYREICEQDGETDTSAQDSLAVHLHNLGIALNYKNDPRLRDTHVLNPRWVTKGIYTLLNDSVITKEKGELTINYLSQALDITQYPTERHGFLLDLMKKFELCLRFEEDENRYLIPDLLDKQQPAEASAFIPADCLNFRYEYSVLPEGLLPRLIVRTHVLSRQPLRWRSGVILTFEGNRALVKSDPQDRHVTINVNGPLESRRRLLAVIRSDFSRIHSSLKSKPEELIPVPGRPAVTIRYKDLLLREEKGRTTFEEVVDGELLELNVQDLLNGVDLEGNRQRTGKRLFDSEKQIGALRLFYSYSHKDEGLRDQLDTHLKILERQGLIQSWHDRRIVGGEDWEKEIDSNLQQADIVLLLISADFIASDYCYNIEMEQAMERHHAGKAKVIPVLLRAADFSGTPFKDLQGFPTDMKPVTQWSDRDSAWLNVETGIKNAIDAIKAKRA